MRSVLLPPAGSEESCDHRNALGRRFSLRILRSAPQIVSLLRTRAFSVGAAIRDRWLLNPRGSQPDGAGDAS
jgi:hypothetical protein